MLLLWSQPDTFRSNLRFTLQEGVPTWYGKSGPKSTVMKVIDTSEEPTTVILLNAHATKLPSNIHVYTRRSVELTALVREATLCSGQQ